MEEKKLEGVSPLGRLLGAVGLCLSTFLIVLDYSIANVSIPYIAGDLAVSADQGTYVITSFAVGNAIVLPITGWLTRRFGLVRVTLFSLLGFIAFSWVCGSSFSLPMLVVARFFQGLVSGPLVPSSQSLLVSIFPQEQRQKALSIWSTIVIVAPILGPILGGWITYDFHWPWIFFINIPIGLFAAFVIRAFLKPFETPTDRPPSDWLGLFFLAIAVSTLQFTLDKGEQYDWLNSTLIRICICTSFIGFVYLIVWEWFKKNPIIELKLLKIPSYALSVFLIGTMYAMYFGSVVLIPLWLQEYMGYTPIWAGIAVAPLGIFACLFTWLLEPLIKKVGLLIPLAISCLLFSLACFVNAYFNTNVDLQLIMLTRLLFGAGILFFVVPVFSLSLCNMEKSQFPQATGLFHFVRALSGGIGTSVFTTLWIRRSAFHHSNLTSTLPQRSLSLENYEHTLSELGFNFTQKWAYINEMITQQAAMLGLNDVLYLMGWIFIALFVIMPLGKQRKRHEKTNPPAFDSPDS